jgi:ATP-binding cassette subfamily B protein RaxB
MFESFFAGARHRLPIFIQTEATECGLCSLAMVANYHGYRTDLASLRLRFSISRKGATLEALMRIAEALRLQTRALRLEMEHLSQLQLPCVLHWNMNHFVVLKSVDARHAVIHDPAVGERRLSLTEFAKHFTGVALEVSPSPEFTGQAQPPKVSLRGLMGRVTGLNRGLAQVALLAVLLELIAMALPFYLQWVVDHVLVTADADMLLVLAAGFGLLVIVHAVISATRGWFVVILSTSLNFQWLGNVFAHLVRLPLDFFEKRHIGHILASFGSVVTIQRTLTTQFAQTVVDGLMTLGTLAMMLFYSPMLTTVSVIAMLLYAALRWLVFRALREASAEQIIHGARQQTHMIETVSGIQSVRLFGKADVRRAGWLNMLADQFNAELRIQRLTLSQDTIRGLLNGLERVIVVWLAARLVLSQQFTAGMLFAYMAYQLQFSTRVAALIDKLAELSMLRLHGERVADIVLQETEGDTQHLPAEIDLTKLPMAIGRMRGDHRAVGLRQDDAGQGDAGAAATDRRRDPRRWHAAESARSGELPAADRHGDAGRPALLGLDRRQHLLLRPGPRLGARRRKCEAGRCRARDRRDANGLSHLDRRIRHRPVRRPEAAHPAGPRAVPPATHAGAR